MDRWPVQHGTGLHGSGLVRRRVEWTGRAGRFAQASGSTRHPSFSEPGARLFGAPAMPTRRLFGPFCGLKSAFLSNGSGLTQRRKERGGTQSLAGKNTAIIRWAAMSSPPRLFASSASLRLSRGSIFNCMDPAETTPHLRNVLGVAVFALRKPAPRRAAQRPCAAGAFGPSGGRRLRVPSSRSTRTPTSSGRCPDAPV